MLKCTFLARFSVAELTKNAANILPAAKQCPYMAKAMLAMSTTSVVKEGSSQEEKKITMTPLLQQQQVPLPPPPQQQQQYNEVKLEETTTKHRLVKCSNANIDCCPFFKKTNIDLNKLISKSPKYDDEVIIDRSETKTISTKPKPESSTSTALFDYEKYFEKKIESKKQDGSYRNFKRVIRHASSFPIVQECDVGDVEAKTAKEITIWCSNDYLGLGRHERVRRRVVEAVEKYGAGSGGTRNISGSTPLHDRLEQELARLHQKEAALIFTSCYVANDTTLYTLARMLPGCHIISDAGNHASMIQGIRNSAVPKTIFRHNDCTHLESVLRSLPKEQPKIVAFESVHSMDGSICDLEKMCDLAHKYGALVYVDEVHAVGLYGENGAGVGERDRVLHKMDLITGTFGKAFGNIGGYIAGSAMLVDTVRSYGSGFIFTTSLPPSVAAGTLAAIEISRSDEGRELRRKHQANAALVKRRLKEVGLPVMDNPSHIVPVMVGNAKHASNICDRLLTEHRIYIQSINYPTVARGEERLRIIPNPHHTSKMVDSLVDSLVDSWQRTGLKLNKSIQ